MDYAAHYEKLISRSHLRTTPAYIERHHIVPRCLGGADALENIAKLTAEEHFMAHKLLVKMFPTCNSLVYAAVQMSVVGKGQTQRANNKVYGWLRDRHIKALSETMRGNSRSKGNVLSAETRAKMSAARTGTKRSEETKQKIRESNIRTKSARPPKEVTAETRQKLSQASKGRPSGMKGKKHSPETRAKMVESQLSRAAGIKAAKAGI